MLDYLKTLITSKSNWMILISAISGLLAKYGYEVSDAFQGQIADAALGIVTVVTGILAIKGHTDLKADVKATTAAK